MGKSQEHPKHSNGSASPEDFVVLVDESVDPRVVAYHDPQSEAAERFRAFRTTLLATLQDRRPRILTVTSSLENEGKSISAVNLGITLADLPNTRVCVVDGDLRKPTLHRLFSVREDPGVAEHLLDGVEPARLVRTVCLGTMDVVPAGFEARRAVDLLGSHRFRDFLAFLRSKYDYVLVDTPPTAAFSDSMVIGGATDGTLLIARLHFTPRAVIEQTIERIRQSGGKVLGAFLVGADA
jgi:capsular exopolysaccharide synthesis family protein